MKSKIKLVLEKRTPELLAITQVFVELKRLQKVKKFIQLNNIKEYKKLNYQEYKSSETLFILGSGQSINNLTDFQWNTIKKNDSLGINFWMIHDFIPTFYMFEFGKDIERIKTFLKLMSLKCENYQHTPFIINILEKELQNSSLSQFAWEQIPEQIKKNTYAPYKISIPGNHVSVFRNSLKLIYEFNLLRNFKNTLFFKRASLSQAILLGLNFGYKQIVLCGVDLNNTKYFYEDYYYQSLNIPIPENIQSGSVHKTIDPLYGELTIDSILKGINELLLIPHSVKLYISSKTSSLYPYLPYYFES
ncbi:hypothetical protein WEU38_06825 [Cyanobacterium aponinum AL20118]|uniref:Uncharacterized protein n=1 Tax=Cyanobacterium aponinum AL20115 TaxID=3090662 RepID=A0AAF1C6Q4_9CHRO|nr:hypothetical protein [Cyanobacterium aponinum]PHV64204.1 hypothetical protein CSQ80_01525 [Cyanobacterium aponinum IPPAS B-1201]WPF89979.1 hypothetical protein SAY89_06850 [Cyanobacterium aponinum AL20115]